MVTAGKHVGMWKLFMQMHSLRVLDVIGVYFKTIWGHLTSCDNGDSLSYRHARGYLGPFWDGWTFGDLGLREANCGQLLE